MKWKNCTSFNLSLSLIVWKRHADNIIMISDHVDLPCRKKKVFYFNDYHYNGMITVTSALKICKSYILHMSVLLTYRQILHCFNGHYILKVTSNCFSHYHKYSKLSHEKDWLSYYTACLCQSPCCFENEEFFRYCYLDLWIPVAKPDTLTPKHFFKFLNFWNLCLLHLFPHNQGQHSHQLPVSTESKPH